LSQEYMTDLCQLMRSAYGTAIRHVAKGLARRKPGQAVRFV